jgi:hypothetical protein
MKLKEIKREEAVARKQVTDKLSAKEKIKKLDQRLGVGIGAKKERDRLMKLINEGKK